MFMQTWGDVFSNSLFNLWNGFVGFVPNVLGALIIFIAGWIVGVTIGKWVSQLVSKLKIDKLFESAGAQDVLDRSGLKLSIGRILGGIVKWFIIIVFLMTSLELIHLSQVNEFLKSTVLLYLPKVLIAALVLVVSTVLADTMKKVVSAAAKVTNIKTANMLGSIVFYAIWAFGLIIALSELGIAAAFMQILFTGVVAAIAIAGGLAFGLGGKEAAARLLSKVGSDMSSKM